ncbi:MAG: hypothetical protein AAF413_02315 [Patescibacteria group bacterium]
MSNLREPIDFFDQLTRADIVGVLVPSVVAFLVGIFVTPIVANALYKHKVWKAKSVAKTVDGKAATITQKLHNDDKRKVPRMGGLVIIASAAITTLLFWALAILFDGGLAGDIDLVNRDQTWIPLFALFVGAALGAADDLAVCGKANSLKIGKYVGGGLSLKVRLAIVGLISLFCGYWFHYKLGIDSIYIPFVGDLSLGLLIIPLVVIAMVATYSGGIIDGIDGLAGGVYSIIFSSYAVIAMMQGKYDLAALCLMIVGGLMAFLWFNIPPARFYLTEVGDMPLTLVIALIAFITETVAILPIIAFPLLVTTASVIIQVLSKKYRGKKVLTVSPLHNNFQVNGWPGHKVTMRYWVFSQMAAVSGIIIYILGY